jgi:hypothetical protein
MARNVYKNSLIRDTARFIAVSAGLLIGALLAVAIVWVALMVAFGTRSSEREDVATDNEVTEPINDSEPAPISNEPTPAIIIDVETLPEVQQKALTTFGFQGQTITISDSQLTCAKDAVGEERLAEIVAGDALGPLEMSKLYGCKDQ